MNYFVCPIKYSVRMSLPQTTCHWLLIASRDFAELCYKLMAIGYLQKDKVFDILPPLCFKRKYVNTNKKTVFIKAFHANF